MKFGGHPCWKVQKALDEQGIPYEVVPGPIRRGQRDDLERLSGQRMYPVIEFDDGRVYREQAKDMAARIEADDVRLGAEVGALGFITDPTDLDLLLSCARTLLDFKAYLDTCEEAAFTDHLTGLANRRRFERQLEREIARTARYGHPFCLVMLDIDNFKRVNDTFGHEAGNEAIRRLAKTLQEGIRGIDLAARIGGDEFALILAETDLARGVEVAERLRQAIRATGIPTVGFIRASLGVAESPSCAQTTPELLALADAALYAAKHQGRDQVTSAQSGPGELGAGGGRTAEGLGSGAG